MDIHATDSHDAVQDHALISAVIAGQTDQFALVLDRYSRYVFKIVSGLVPRDVVQDLAHDVFVEAFRSLAKFDGRLPFKKWLAGIATHQCYDYWREQARTREVPLSQLTEDSRCWLDAVLAAPAQDSHERAALRQEARDVLQWALAGLSAADRMVLSLVHLEGYSVKEAAELLGWSVISVKVRAHRSRLKMRKRLATLSEE
jgi:RNA polymerase sigma-70 factor, ECF subfamily